MRMNEMIQFFRQLSGKLNSNLYASLPNQTSLQQMAFLREIQREMKQKNSLDIPLKELKVVVFDLETTGFYPEKGDQIISIGAIKMTGTQIMEQETFYTLVKSTLPLSEEISALTNIYEKDLISAPDARDALMKFFQFIKSDLLVAHHATHEQSFMKKMTSDVLRTRFDHRIVDTSFLIRLANPYMKSAPLEDVCVECGIEVKNRHHALNDALMTAKVWRHYLQLAEEKGFLYLRQVYEYLAKIG
ncbi:exonuclease domain-containing protein [Neobacillus cucumis]|uniref:DNA polymerase III subunit epsilon n=1 Tax=Neobacillus cucumis TaxID=1740721 RepID=A0A2N5HCL0_9BACI|nr:exonuclease domain-containing protein [Neobacillus cucumis]PLS03256.1 DNA polymerase III subunit epsilon [Neobacillus cucumis]